MIILYNLAIVLYAAFAKMAAPFNPKARKWVEGRKNWEAILKQKITSGEKYVWIHCASLGEFEQGRPVIEALKIEKPQYKILLTFFSPSGYEIRKNYGKADVICYLPLDTPANAAQFISLVNPVYAIFVKYEFWHNFIAELYQKQIPLYLISGIFRKDQHFFKWYGNFFYRMLEKFTWIFVQDKGSEDLLKKNGLNNVSVAGDTRFDRVKMIAGNAGEIWQIRNFRGTEKLFIAGSSWRQDEEIIAGYIDNHPSEMKWVFAPHEIDPDNIDRIKNLLRVKSVRISEFSDASADARVLIIDNIGMLSAAYRYAYIAAIGGGFGKGIHNILEAACWGVPVMFGPKYSKFREAVEMIELGSAKSFKNSEDFCNVIEEWLTDEKSYDKSAGSAADYVLKNTGATDKIIGRLP